MDITCHKCNTVSSIPDAAIPDEGIHFECPHCSTQLFAKIDNSSPEEDLFGDSSLSLELDNDLDGLEDLSSLDLDINMDDSSSLAVDMKELGEEDISPSMIYNPSDIPEKKNQIPTPAPNTNKVSAPPSFKEKKDISTTKEQVAPVVASSSLESYLTSKSASVQQEKARLSPVLILLMTVVLVGGAVGYYFFFMKNKNLKQQMVMSKDIKQLLIPLKKDNPINYKNAFREINDKLANNPKHILYKSVYVYIAAKYFVSIETIIDSFAPDYNTYYNQIKKFAAKSDFIKKTIVFHDLANVLKNNKELSSTLKRDIQQLPGTNTDPDILLLKGYIYYKTNNLERLTKLVNSSKLKKDDMIPAYYLLLKLQFESKQNISPTIAKISEINPNHINSMFYNVRFYLSYNQLDSVAKELKRLDKLQKRMSDYELTKLFILKAKLAELQLNIKEAYNFIRTAEDLKVKNDYFFKEILNFYFNNYYDNTALNMLKYAYKKRYSKDFKISKIYIELLIRNEDFGKAGQVSTDLRNKYPKKPEVYYLSALLSDSLENRTMAVDFLKKALELNSKYQDAIVLLSKEYIAKGEDENAETLLEDAVRDLKENDRVKEGLALLYFRKNEFKKANKLFQDLLLKKSTSIDKILVDFKLNVINLKLNKQTEEETLRNLYVLYNKSPNFLGIRVEIAKLEINFKKYEKAIKILKEELKIRGNSISGNLQLGIAYYLKKDYSLAEEFLNKTISLDAKNHLAFSYLGKSLKGNNKLNKALEAFQNAYSYNKKEYNYLLDLARTHVELNHAPEAYDAYEKAIKLKATFEALYEYGSLYLKQGDSVNALKYFNMSYQINSKNPKLILEMGNLFYKDQNYKKAIEFYKKVIKLDNKNAEAFYMMGDSYRSLEKFKAAVRFYLKAIKLNPNKGKYYYQLGYLYKGMKKYKSALSTFKLYLKKVPNSPDRNEIKDEIYDLQNL